MRKALIVALAAGLVLLVVGCGQKTTGPVRNDEVLEVGEVDGIFGVGDPDDIIEGRTVIEVRLGNGEQIEPGTQLPDWMPVLATMINGRVIRTTWGQIKDVYGGGG